MAGLRAEIEGVESSTLPGAHLSIHDQCADRWVSRAWVLSKGCKECQFADKLAR